MTGSGAIGGAMASVEELYALKVLMMALGSGNMDARQDGSVLTSVMGRASYLFNATIDGIEDADAILIIGSNPRLEASVLNARIRKSWLAGNTRIGLIGEQADLKYRYDYLGAGADALADLASGKGDFFKILKQAERPLILVGQGALNHDDAEAVLGQAAKLAVASGAVSKEWNGFSAAAYRGQCRWCAGGRLRAAGWGQGYCRHAEGGASMCSSFWARTSLPLMPLPRASRSISVVMGMLAPIMRM